MSEKHLPGIGGTFDRLVFDGDGTVWVPERMCRIIKKPIELPDPDPDFEVSFEVCSACGWPDMYTTGKDFSPRPVWFCPRCGAKVRGDA